MSKYSSAYVFQSILPIDVVYTIDNFIPRSPKKKKQTISPSFQKELQRIQSLELKGKSGMYMRGLDDFVLD
jgi:hypothetical protein